MFCNILIFYIFDFDDEEGFFVFMKDVRFFKKCIECFGIEWVKGRWEKMVVNGIKRNDFGMVNEKEERDLDFIYWKKLFGKYCDKIFGLLF